MNVPAPARKKGQTVRYKGATWVIGSVSQRTGSLTIKRERPDHPGLEETINVWPYELDKPETESKS